jgi:hypothetical protein
MMQKASGMAEKLANPDYSQVFKSSNTEQRKSNFSPAQESSSNRVNYEEVGQKLQTPDYGELFLPQRSGHLVKPHVYKL